MKTFIAVDIGGTMTRVAVFPESGIVPLKQKNIPTSAQNEKAEDRVLNLIAELWPSEAQVQAISLGAPGAVNNKRGIIYKTPNISGWGDIPLRSLVEGRFNVPVLLGNDSNLAAVGEWRFGAGIGHHNLIYITVSTGLGGGVIIEDQLLVGENGMATELGHVVILPDGPVCSCGQRGHLEALTSGTSIANIFRQRLADGHISSLSASPPPTTREIASAAQNGDGLARQSFEEAGWYLGLGLANFLHIFNPSIVIFGGGVSHSGELLFSPLRASLEKHVLSKRYLEDLTILPAALGDQAGLFGALAVAREQIEGVAH